MTTTAIRQATDMEAINTLGEIEFFIRIPLQIESIASEFLRSGDDAEPTIFYLGQMTVCFRISGARRSHSIGPISDWRICFGSEHQSP